MWKIADTLDGWWWIENTKSGKRKKIGPVTGKGRNYYDIAVEETFKRNLKKYGEEVQIIGNDKYNRAGENVGTLEQIS